MAIAERQSCKYQLFQLFCLVQLTEEIGLGSSDCEANTLTTITMFRQFLRPCSLQDVYFASFYKIDLPRLNSAKRHCSVIWSIGMDWIYTSTIEVAQFSCYENPSTNPASFLAKPLRSGALIKN